MRINTKIQFFKVALPKPWQLPSAHSNLVICVTRDATTVMGLKDAVLKFTFIFIIQKASQMKNLIKRAQKKVPGFIIVHNPEIKIKKNIATIFKEKSPKIWS